MRPKDNPFASHRVEAVPYQFQTGSLAELLERIERPGFRGAIVGPKGHGKTTLLEEIATSLKTRGRLVRLLRLSESERRSAFCARPAKPGEIILLDGAEQLRPLEWWKFRWKMRRAGSLLVTTHRPGRLPTRHRCETTPALLSEITAQLLGNETDLPAVSTLFTRHRGDIRQALRECYDRASRSGTGAAARGRVTSRSSFRRMKFVASSTIK